MCAQSNALLLTFKLLAHADASVLLLPPSLILTFPMLLLELLVQTALLFVTCLSALAVLLLLQHLLEATNLLWLGSQGLPFLVSSGAVVLQKLSCYDLHFNGWNCISQVQTQRVLFRRSARDEARHGRYAVLRGGAALHRLQLGRGRQSFDV